MRICFCAEKKSYLRFLAYTSTHNGGFINEGEISHLFRKKAYSSLSAFVTNYEGG